MRLVLLLYLLKLTSARFTCNDTPRKLHYYKIRSCHRSSLELIAKRNITTLPECISFAYEKQALAFNYSPPEAASYLKKTTRNCQVLECPETDFNSSSLVFDVAWDYFSAYGNNNATALENATCIKSLGLFGFLPEKQNYTEAIIKCHAYGGDLANVLTEFRTNTLAHLVNSSIAEWYKAAYIGMDDMQMEGKFQIASGTLIDCFRFRAWAPGHPRSKHKSEDCVILESFRTWRTVKCKVKLFALCEFFPEKPIRLFENEMAKNISCKDIRKRREKKKCLKQKALHEVYLNSSRIDRCGLLYD